MALEAREASVESAFKQQPLSGDAKTSETLGQNDDCKEKVLAKGESLVRFYKRLAGRWRGKPVFLQRTLSYNLEYSEEGQGHPGLRHSPAPLQTKDTKPPSNGVTRGECNGSSIWELEITASIFSPSNGDQWLAKLGEKLAAMGAAPHVPAFFAFCSPGPLQQADSTQFWPVDRFYTAWVPLVKSLGGAGKKLVLQLPGDADSPPDGQVFCLIWDGIRDILALMHQSSFGTRDVSPVAALPPSGSGTWSHAVLRARPDRPPLPTMPLVNRSKVTCLPRTQDLFGDQAISVQASRNSAIRTVLRMSMRLSRAAPAIAHPVASPVSRPVVLNAQRNRAPFVQSPSANGQPVSGATQKVALVLYDKEAGAFNVTASDLSCVLCMRRFPSFEALQTHLWSTHDRFQYSFEHIGPTLTVLATPSPVDLSEVSPSESNEEASFSEVASQAEPFVYWKGAYLSREAAFHVMQERAKRKRRKRETGVENKRETIFVELSEEPFQAEAKPPANGRASLDGAAKVQETMTSCRAADPPRMSSGNREASRPAREDRPDMQRLGKRMEGANEQKSNTFRTSFGAIQTTTEAGGLRIDEDPRFADCWKDMKASEEAHRMEEDEDRPILGVKGSREVGRSRDEEDRSILWGGSEGSGGIDFMGDRPNPSACEGQRARSLIAEMARCTEAAQSLREESPLSRQNKVDTNADFETDAREDKTEAQSSWDLPEGWSLVGLEQRAREGSTSLDRRLSGQKPAGPNAWGFPVKGLSADPPASESEAEPSSMQLPGASSPLDFHRTAKNEDEGAMVPRDSSSGAMMAPQEGSRRELLRSPSKRKGGNKTKRTCMDDHRNIKRLKERPFYHSRTGMPMDWLDVISNVDSEDEIDEEELQRDDKKLLHEFTDVSNWEKEMMFKWNCFAREQRIAADAHMRWAARAFAHVNKRWIGTEPNYRRVFMLMLFTFWNRALITGDDVDECLKIVDSARL